MTTYYIVAYVGIAQEHRFNGITRDDRPGQCNRMQALMDKGDIRGFACFKE